MRKIRLYPPPSICSHIRKHQWISMRTRCNQLLKLTSLQILEKSIVWHTCVCANVSSEEPRSGESLATRGAHAGQRVWSNVHFQGTQAVVLLGAVFAVEDRACWSLCGHRSLGSTGGELVGHLMLGKCREAGVALGAVQTVIDWLNCIWAWWIWSTSAVLLFLTAAAGGRAAEVQRAHGWRRERFWGNQGVRSRQDVHAEY